MKKNLLRKLLMGSFSLLLLLSYEGGKGQSNAVEVDDTGIKGWDGGIKGRGEGGGNCYDNAVKNEGSGNLSEGGSNLVLREGGSGRSAGEGSHSLVQPGEGGHGFALTRDGGHSFGDGSHGR